MDLCKVLRQEAVARHRKENPWLPQLKHQQHGSHRDHCSKRDDPCCPIQPESCKDCSKRVSNTKLVPRLNASQHRRCCDVDQRTDDERTDNGDWHILSRIAALFRRRRDRIEADERKENEACAGPHPRETIGQKRRPVIRLHVECPDGNEEKQDHNFQRHHHIIGPGRLLDADNENPRHCGNDCDCKKIVDEWNTEDGGMMEPGLIRKRYARCNCSASGSDSFCSLVRRAIIDGEPRWDVKANSFKQLMEVRCPRNRNGNVANRIFDNEIPPNNPRHKFTQRRIRVGVGTAGDRDERRKLRIGQGTEAARDRCDDEREHNTWTCAEVVRATGSGCANDRKNPCAYNRSDPQGDEINGTEGALQMCFG